MGGSWYYRRSGQLTGPVPFHELRQLASSGELSPDDEVRTGHGYWQEARSVDELWADLALFLNEATEKFSAGDSGDSLTEMLESGELAVVSGCDATSISPTNDQRQFFCRKSGERTEIGPVALVELQAEVNKGRLQPNDRIREDGSLCWIPCRELPELRFPTAPTLPPETPVAVPERLAAEEPSRDEEAEAEQAVETATEDVQAGNAEDWEEVLFAPEEEAVPDVGTAAPSPRVEPAVVEETPSRAPVASPAARPLPPLPVPEAPTAAKPAKRVRLKGPGFQIPRLNSPLFYVLGALLVVLVVVKLWPSHSGLHGEVRVDGAPLPAGSLTFTPAGDSPRKGLSVGVVDGQFEVSEQKDELPPGSYDVVVTIGNPLGFQTASLDESSPLSGLNGATLTTSVTIESGNTDPILMDLASSDAVRLESGDASVLGAQ